MLRKVIIWVEPFADLLDRLRDTPSELPLGDQTVRVQTQGVPNLPLVNKVERFLENLVALRRVDVVVRDRVIGPDVPAPKAFVTGDTMREFPATVRPVDSQAAEEGLTHVSLQTR